MSVRGLVLLLFALGALLVGAGAVFRCEGDPPRVEAPEAWLVGRAPRPLVLELSDEGSGLRQARVVLVHAKGETALEARDFPGGPIPFLDPTIARETLEVTVDAKALDLEEGDARLRVIARDWSWNDLLRGNLASVEIPVTIDLRPPRLRASAGLTYVKPGGAGLLVYEVLEETSRDGVQVGERFFPGAPIGPGDPRRAALFAIPVDADPDIEVRLVAEDRAGNQTSSGAGVRVQERSFPDEPIRLSQRFLDGKATRLAEAVGVEASDPIAAFQEVNTRIRARDEARIGELLAGAEPERLFEGRFEQWANSKVTSRFAERRSYLVDGEIVSRAVHYGYDLASTAGAPVTAANRGRVLFAGDLGIYGQCVILDHGMGLASLYGHLSSLTVAEGDPVEKRQTLGTSGDTGLAGGDHLHFAILVHGVYVDPIEWWDAKWVSDHVESRLATPAP